MIKMSVEEYKSTEKEGKIMKKLVFKEHELNAEICKNIWTMIKKTLYETNSILANKNVELKKANNEKLDLSTIISKQLS